MTALTEEDYEKAFDYFYYYDHAIDENVTISYKEAKILWIKRVTELKEKATYLKSFINLKIVENDGWREEYVTLDMMENNGENIYDGYISFMKIDGEWKIIGLYELNVDDSVDKDWEKSFVDS